MSAESSPGPHSVQYESFGQLGDLELEFEKAEVEVLKHSISLTTPLYARRNQITATLTSFWPTVFDSTPEFDQHIAPQDVGVISTITSVNVIRTNPEIEPRDFIIELTFDETKNEWFDNITLRKQFWWKMVESKWSGLVSEPVEIKWKNGKDLSNGETSRAYKEFMDKKKSKNSGKGKGKAVNGDGKGKKKSLEERTGGGQPSFFTWFAWKGKGTDVGEENEEAEGKTKEDDIFNHGDELALTIADDMYPNAIKYYLESITGGGYGSDSEMSVSDLEDDEDDDDEDGVLKINIGESDDEEAGIGGSSGVKRHDITPPGSDDEEEDEAESRRKRVKK